MPCNLCLRYVSALANREVMQGMSHASRALTEIIMWCVILIQHTTCMHVMFLDYRLESDCSTTMTIGGSLRRMSS